MAILSEGGTSSPDLYIALCFLLLPLISTPLNSLVLLHNYKKPKSVARLLYMGLAAVDLLACIVLSITSSVGALAPKEEECWEINSNRTEICEEQYYLYFKEDATFGQRIIGLAGWVLQQVPCQFTGFLAITRYYKIKFPLRHLSKKLVVGLLISGLLYTSIFISVYSFDPNDLITWTPSIQTTGNFSPDIFGYNLTQKQLIVLALFATILIQIAAITTSILTILELLKNFRNPITDGSRRVSTRGSIKIMITNFGSVLFLVSVICLMEFAQEHAFSEIFIIFIMVNIQFLPAFISALNPVIYIAFTPDSREVLTSVSNSVSAESRM